MPVNPTYAHADQFLSVPYSFTCVIKKRTTKQLQQINYIFNKTSIIITVVVFILDSIRLRFNSQRSSYFNTDWPAWWKVFSFLNPTMLCSTPGFHRILWTGPFCSLNISFCISNRGISSVMSGSYFFGKRKKKSLLL